VYDLARTPKGIAGSLGIASRLNARYFHGPTPAGRSSSELPAAVGFFHAHVEPRTPTSVPSVPSAPSVASNDHSLQSSASASPRFNTARIRRPSVSSVISCEKLNAHLAPNNYVLFKHAKMIQQYTDRRLTPSRLPNGEGISWRFPCFSCSRATRPITSRLAHQGHQTLRRRRAPNVRHVR
jgi:hypothetical protein